MKSINENFKSNSNDPSEDELYKQYFSTESPKDKRTSYEQKVSKYAPRYNGVTNNLSLGTANGIGVTLMGEFRPDSSRGVETYVSYEFLVVFFFPIIPFGCYRVKEGATYSPNHKRSTTNYRIFGTEQWVFKEILIIYGRAILILGIVIGILFLISVICEMF